MQICRSDAYPNGTFLGASAARISRKLASLQDFLRMRAGFVDGSADPLSPTEMMHIVDEINSLHPLVEAMESAQFPAWATVSASPTR
jgi:hypothetical protein